MNQLNFYKFDGAGNDFILIDIRHSDLQLSQQHIANICHRRFGVGADGLMTLGLADGYDFEMRYYNSDGYLGSMCGNGGRCITAFAHMLSIKPQQPNCYHFVGYDGPHEGEILEWDPIQRKGIVRLAMKNIAVENVHRCLDGWFLDTGSPHYVQWVDDLEHYDVVGEGRRLRYLDSVFPEGTNVDFIEKRSDGTLFVRTYERGVEDETWACGTGVTACALVSGCKQLATRGGSFNVTFQSLGSTFSHVRLIGPVSCNFEGCWSLNHKFPFSKE